MSKGSENLLSLIQQLFGEDVKVLTEYVVGENLRLDFFLPSFKLGFEYHGVQHRKYVEHFHGSAAGFAESQQRDSRKIELCLMQGIHLVSVWDNEEITAEILASKVKDALLEENLLFKLLYDDIKKDKKYDYKETLWYKKTKEEFKVKRKELYKKRKEANKLKDKGA